MATRCTMCKLMLMAVLMGSLEMVANASSQVPCFFIFGDSLSDGGNNNDLMSAAKANYLPYGIDFPGGPTGRFCNGKTTVDIIGDLMGLDGYIPSFPKSKTQGGAMGVNYASGSAGIRENTGYQVGERICMDTQLKNHQTTISRLTEELGGAANATSHLNKCLYSVYLGSNDWMLDYYNPSAGGTSVQYTPPAFADVLISKLTEQVTRLHSMGARKVVLFGVGPLGCLPAYNALGTCAQYINTALQDYNDKVKGLVDKLNSWFHDSKFIYINSIEIIGKDLSNLGLPIKNVPCCETVGSSCVPLSTPCFNRNNHAYWDHAHPTEAANRVLASRAYKAQNPSDTYPMDISHLVQFQLQSPAQAPK